MILKSINYNGFKFEKIDTSKENYVRVEVGISMNTQYKEISSLLRENYCFDKSVHSIQNSFKEPLLNKFFKSKNVFEYMSNYGLNQTQIDDFFTISNSVSEGIGIKDSFYDLGEQQQRTIQIYIMTIQYKVIFVETEGMYLSILLLTYKLLKVFIDNGGTCIEVTYPHFKNGDDLEASISSNPKVIKVGEMTINNNL
ncbi:hypothetical protein [Flammeovirga sp. EKP202]|uniref:hypothetical protein n=1 Tax=Flammeovirga sp. EKP202 TaxID=2770592 RepID=UPI00165F3480|nr:hypothetical protein [Flammeovirga sp. EKP202]MBD0403709.1 hypothetical protein [Flammeovirga sp. EKP202]